MANIFNQRGEKLRLGVAGIKKCLMAPDRISEDVIDSDKVPRDQYLQEIPSFAMVWNDEDESEIYLSRHGIDKDCVFNLTYWEGGVEFSVDFPFKERDKVINLFIKKVKQCSATND